MEKILFALGHRELEDYLMKRLKKEYLLVGNLGYREGVVKMVGQTSPDILVIRETLEGSENIMKIIYEVKTKSPKTRIVFIAGKRESGDVLLATLVNYGVYDILQGENIQANEIIGLVRKPNEHKDVRHLQPVPVLDEKTNQMIFQAPDAIEREVVKEVFVEKPVVPPGFVPEAPKMPQEAVVKTVEVEKPKKVEYEEHEEHEEHEEYHKEKMPKEERADVKEAKGWLKKKASRKDHHSVSQSQASAPQPQVEMSFDMQGHGSQRIVTFVGGGSGVGTTALALNTAIAMAKEGKRVLFLEFNDKQPRANYWLDAGKVSEGIDTCLRALKSGKYEQIDKAIITSESLKKEDSAMQGNYRKFPKTLDFLFFSKEYLSNIGEAVDMSLSKELYLYLSFQKGYDCIVIDVQGDLQDDSTLNALIYSNKIFTVITQDVSTIGYYLYKMNELKKKGIETQDKTTFIINKYEKADLTVRDIEKWIGHKNMLTIPMSNREFIDANYCGMPVYLNTKSQELKRGIERIVGKM